MKATAIGEPTNGAAAVISFEQPYAIKAKVRGTAPLLFHRWNVDAVAAKSAAAKGSKAKKEDDLESYVYRESNGLLALPTEYFRMAVINAAKFRQDPRSPRKSAMDLFKAGVVSLTDLCSLGAKDWEFVDRRRVQVQRNGLTRCRPAMNTGWETDLMLYVLLPEYITNEMLNEVLQSAGKLVGVGDFRPTFGRFQVTGFEVTQDI
jgi:hypothetical protein